MKSKQGTPIGIETGNPEQQKKDILVDNIKIQL